MKEVQVGDVQRGTDECWPGGRSELNHTGPKTKGWVEEWMEDLNPVEEQREGANESERLGKIEEEEWKRNPRTSEMTEMKTGDSGYHSMNTRSGKSARRTGGVYTSFGIKNGELTSNVHAHRKGTAGSVVMSTGRRKRRHAKHKRVSGDRHRPKGGTLELEQVTREYAERHRDDENIIAVEEDKDSQNGSWEGDTMEVPEAPRGTENEEGNWVNEHGKESGLGTATGMGESNDKETKDDESVEFIGRGSGPSNRDGTEGNGEIKVPKNLTRAFEAAESVARSEKKKKKNRGEKGKNGTRGRSSQATTRTSRKTNITSPGTRKSTRKWSDWSLQFYGGVRVVDNRSTQCPNGSTKATKGNKRYVKKTMKGGMEVKLTVGEESVTGEIVQGLHGVSTEEGGEIMGPSSGKGTRGIEIELGKTFGLKKGGKVEKLVEWGYTELDGTAKMIHDQMNGDDSTTLTRTHTRSTKTTVTTSTGSRETIKAVSKSKKKAESTQGTKKRK